MKKLSSGPRQDRCSHAQNIDETDSAAPIDSLPCTARQTILRGIRVLGYAA